MKVTRHTRMRNLLPLLNEERVKQLLAAIPAKPLDKPLMRMTCGEFIGALDEDYAMHFFKERRAFDAFGKYRQFLDEMEGITAYLKRYEVETNADEKAAARGVDFPTMQERILLDCVRAYSLHSTAEAEALPVADWLIVVKNEGSAALYQRRLNKINEAKMKHGRKQ